MSKENKIQRLRKGHNGYSIRVYKRGKVRAVKIHPPEAVWKYLMTDEIRSNLVKQAYGIVHDWGIAEDIVQSSFISTYCKFNNGTFYAVKYEKGYLLIQGGEDYSLPKERMAPLSGGGGVAPLSSREMMSIMLQRSREDAAVEKVGKWRRGEEVQGMEVIEKPFAWMHTIIERNANKFYIKQKRWYAFAMNSANWSLVEDSRNPNPEQAILQAERCVEIRELVLALPPHYRDILKLRYFQKKDYSFEEIAEKLHRPLSTVTSQSNRAHKMLKEAWEGKRVVKDGKLVRRKKLES